jgi:hypothetical protein
VGSGPGLVTGIGIGNRSHSFSLDIIALRASPIAQTLYFELGSLDGFLWVQCGYESFFLTRP